MGLENLLKQQLQAAGYSIDTKVQQQLLSYLLLLDKWNKAYNLTSIRDPVEMIAKHILDSLTIGPFLHGKKIADVGSGAGLPGIPLALTYPELQFTLLDSNGKKTRFLTQVVTMLAISNVQVIQTRVEEFKPAHCFDSIVARAFSSLADFLAKTRHFCCTGGQFLAMKGNYPATELAAISPEFKMLAVHELNVVGVDASRHLVCLSCSAI